MRQAGERAGIHPFPIEFLTTTVIDQGNESRRAIVQYTVSGSQRSERGRTVLVSLPKLSVATVKHEHLQSLQQQVRRSVS